MPYLSKFVIVCLCSGAKIVRVELEFRLNRTAYENKTFEWRLRVFNPFKQIIDVFFCSMKLKKSGSTIQNVQLTSVINLKFTNELKL
jgi:hypothetical protein